MAAQLCPPVMIAEKRAELERILGHKFGKEYDVEEVTTHSSLLNEPSGTGRESNSRLAHLGDAVVELAVRSALFERFPDAKKGDLTKAKKPIVSNAGLAGLASAKAIGVLLDRGGSRPPELDNDTILAEAFESAIAAVFLDTDFETAAEVVERLVPLPKVLS